jgi:hypothetical protein
MSMSRQPTPRQFDLFSNQLTAKTPQVPRWPALPEGTRQHLTKLIVRLILDHVDSSRSVQREGVDHDA